MKETWMKWNGECLENRTVQHSAVQYRTVQTERDTGYCLSCVQLDRGTDT